MRVTFLGATHEVTGSCTLIEAGGKFILVDCGMEQGTDEFQNMEIPINPAHIDCVLLTHAHIDHSGKLPVLTKNGFKGKIYCTHATASLCEIMLKDSAHIQEFEAEWRNRKAKRSGTELYEPSYTMKDVESTLKYFRPQSYSKTVQILENVLVRFNDMGHLLGSSSIEVFLTEGHEERKIVFSGDVGNYNQPIICDTPVKVKDADYVVIESTYGNRLHERLADNDYSSALAGFIQSTLDRGGNVIIPSFAVGRTQEILYFLREIKQHNLVKGHGNFSVYIDSPLANEATDIFLQCDRECLDDKTKNILDHGINPLFFDGLKISVTGEESKAINFDNEPKVIIASSGMCEAGRIRHHLKHNLWRPECLILFVGYQGVGTLGRSIYDGSNEVKLFGETISVRAQIAYLPGISGHADKNGLLDWLSGFEKKPKKVFVNHGDDESCTDFTATLNDELGYDAFAPFSGTSYDLINGDFVEVTEGIPAKPEKSKTKKSAAVFDRLIAAVKRLTKIAEEMRGHANKDIARFADNINSLCDKYDK